MYSRASSSFVLLRSQLRAHQFGEPKFPPRLTLRLDVVLECDGGPLVSLCVEDGGEFGGSSRMRHQTETCKARPDIRTGEDIGHFRGDPFAQCRRHVFGSEHPEQATREKPWISCLS